jgi:glycosyltransferase involved in cell wall biosynthesis
MKKTLKNSKALIVFHEASTGPGHDLRDYLIKQEVKELLFIAHPLLYLKENFKNATRYEYYRKGKLVLNKKTKHWSGPEPLLYIKDTFYTVSLTIKYLKKADLFFGLGNLNAFAGYLLKLFGFVDCLIYYVIDYVPNRFKNPALNAIYHRIEKIAAEKSNWTWNLSPRMIEGRNKKWGKKFPNQIVVPHGVHINRIKHVPFSKINKTEVLYMGTLLQKQGIQLVLESIKILAKHIPEIHFTIIGKGPYESNLRSLTKKLGIEKYVSFLGYIKNHEEMENRIAQTGIAIALYDKTHDEFSYYADPGKIKNYLGAGVPVVMTDVPYVAREIQKANCGFIVPYKKNVLIKTLLYYFSDIEMMKKYRSNALKFAKRYEWNDIFAKGLSKIYN